MTRSRSQDSPRDMRKAVDGMEGQGCTDGQCSQVEPIRKKVNTDT